MKIIILAGGSGARLWPASTTSGPKQFLRFGGDWSLLQATIKRFLRQFSPADILILTNQAYLDLIKEQLQQIEMLDKVHILTEPYKKNTGPALALAVKYLQDKLGAGSDESLLVAASDHIIHPEDVFLAQLHRAQQVCQAGWIVTLGIKPHKPETGYGYIKTKKNEAFDYALVEHFVEKPGLKAAKEFLHQGDYLWNSGIFIFKIQTFLEELQTHCPPIWERSAGSYEQMVLDFAAMPELSLDYAVMEKTKRAVVLPLEADWSDVGSWDSVYEALEKDAHQNVKIGRVSDLETKNCLIMGTDKLIATVGLQDLLIIETKEAILVAKRGDSQKIKKLMEKIQDDGCG